MCLVFTHIISKKAARYVLQHPRALKSDLADDAPSFLLLLLLMLWQQGAALRHCHCLE